MADEILLRAAQLIKQHETKDPFRIARAEGAEIVFGDLGTMKGMYNHMKRNRFIVINNTLDEYTQRLVCAHELGHDQLHRALADNRWLREFMIYNMKNRPEYEANVFAAELLLPDDEVVELVENGCDIQQIAGEMYADINLVALKFGTLAKKGYDVRQFEFRDNFLK
ncbi:MAG: ImmA/IrrE family metallo-endopeptidase [Oscillospiraceae bacterium]|jgi:Zn-dependent peptidase ImmA (M78 family)|nr:ImmA/IrrE family metallo-endopeptidase [Oscillospiraceae bacterium]